jgi:hypothetical protein
MKLDAHKNFKNTLVFLNPKISPFLNPTSLGHVTVATRFSDFLILLIGNSENFDMVIIDGKSMHLEDWKAERINIVRVLMTKFTLIRYVIYSTRSLGEFQLQNSNLTVVEKDLSKQNINEELLAATF